MGIVIGPEVQNFVKQRNRDRIRIANRRSLETSKEARMTRKSARFTVEDMYEKAEGILYAAEFSLPKSLNAFFSKQHFCMRRR